MYIHYQCSHLNQEGLNQIWHHLGWAGMVMRRDALKVGACRLDEEEKEKKKQADEDARPRGTPEGILIDI